jgi:hypothetical protein
MGNRLQSPVLALGALLLTVTGAQTPPQRMGNLEFHLQPERVERGVPQRFTFLLVNKTNHDVRVPIPTVECEDSFNGHIELRLRFTPLKPGSPDEGRGCADDREDWPHLFYDGSQSGTYEFWAVYSPPSVDSADQRTLQKSGIDFPHEKLRTRRVFFLKEE